MFAVVIAPVLLGQTSALRATAASPHTILFIGNSFTFGYGSPVRFFHPERVTDLNHECVGGVPALFKTFTIQLGLNYDVSLETSPGKNIDWHLANKRAEICRPWEIVIAQGYSTLDAARPGNPALLIEATKKLAMLLTEINHNVSLWLTATWSRADQAYEKDGPWIGTPIEQMALDIRDAYDRAAAAPGIQGVIPVGQAWNRAMATHVADPNPYDGITCGTVNLWTWDNYHASTYGYYLEALLVLGKVTGRDPRDLGKNEHAALELGISPEQAATLQQVAHDELTQHGDSLRTPDTVLEKSVGLAIRQ